MKGEDRYEILYDDGDHDVDVPAKVSAPIKAFFMCTDSTQIQQECVLFVALLSRHH